MDEVSQIRQESHVPKVLVKEPHTSRGHSGRDDGKTEKSQDPLEGNSSENSKDSYSARSQSPTKDNSSPIRKRKHSKKSMKRKRKRKYSSSSSSAIRKTSDSDSSDNEPAIKRFKVVPEDKWYKFKISKSMASFANEHFELYLSGKELHSNITIQNPGPDNVNQNNKLDDFAISILKDRRRSTNNELINQDKVLEKIQVKIRDIMGHFC